MMVRAKWQVVTVGAGLLTAMSSLAVGAKAPDHCDNKIQAGESAGPFFGLENALIGFALAEKYCGSRPKPLAPVFLAYVERNGCGPTTDIHKNIASSVSAIERATLAELAAGGDANLKLSSDDVQQWAKMAAESLGGCAGLKRMHDKGLDK